MSEATEFVSRLPFERVHPTTLAISHPGLTVHLDFVRPHGDRIHFEPVPH